jgi:hydrogenase expression/formation protein HypC
MCLGVPGLVVERMDEPADLERAVVEFGGVRRVVCIACVPEVRPGDYVIVHAGLAISIVDAEEAARVLAELQAMGDEDGWRTGA